MNNKKSNDEVGVQMKKQSNKYKNSKSDMVFSYLSHVRHTPWVKKETDCLPKFEPLPHRQIYKELMFETFNGILTQHEIDKTIEEAIKSLEEDSIG
jgi:hypothetical protein